jgi:multiple sugar transport system ATP-binding protein
MAEVVINDVSKVFSGGTTALDHIDLAVSDGEFLVLVGPSGCGKSTLLRIVAGLEDPSDGTVAIDGQVVNNLAPRERDIAMVFQNYALYPHMTVDENLGFSLRIAGLKRDQIRTQVLDVAQTLALEQLLARKPAALSGGQRQRVAMGRAMVRHPKVFLMDEPLSNLDAKLRVAMRGELMRLHQQDRTTTLYVTHDQVEAMTLGDRIAVLDKGRLQQVGTPEQLYQSPANVFVAGFIGSPSMNLARGRISQGQLDLGSLKCPLPQSNCPPDGDVVAGFRPSALALSTQTGDTAHEARLTVTVITVESLGDEKNVLFLPPFEVPEVANGPQRLETELTAMWTARVDPQARVSPGDHISLCFDLDAAYYFDAATGLAIHPR